MFQAPASRWKRGNRYRELAAYHQPLLLDEIEGTCLMLFTQELKWTYEEVQVFLAAVRKDYTDPYLKIFQNM